MKNCKDGYVLLLIFLFLSSILSVGIIVFYQSMRCYQVAHAQYRYYQRKYLLEGLLNYAIEIVTKSFDIHCTDKRTVYHFDAWVKQTHQSYDADVEALLVESEKIEKIKLLVTLSAQDEQYLGSCYIIRNGKQFIVEEWMCE